MSQPPSKRQRLLQTSTSNPRSVACQVCHRRKVKCSGGEPCKNCQQAGHPDQCTYPTRDRHIRISQEEIGQLLRENELLRDQLSRHSLSRDASIATTNTVEIPREAQENLQNPLLEGPWFEPLECSNCPIHISEAADAAFATRARQSVSSAWGNHIPRWSFAKDEQLSALSAHECPWPTPFRARFLVRTAFDTFCRYAHAVRKSTVLDDLEKAIKDPSTINRLTHCKLMALFALGEVYATKTVASEDSFPGIRYFARARRLTYHDIERPRIDDIEIMVLLSWYSSTLNRRHSAYMFATSAIRLSLMLGLHMNVPERQLRDRGEREHRIRLWWTTFMLDRRTTSKLGQPVNIMMDDIHVDLPSHEGLADEDKQDFGDSKFAVCKIELAKLEERIIASIYARRIHSEPFSQRVQSIMRDLTRWVEDLPPQIQIDRTAESPAIPNHILHLHLTFNQCLILATRPILLHAFRAYKESWKTSSTDSTTQLSESIRAIVDTCIQCARHSYRLLSDSWIAGSFPMYDYPQIQYLFSAAIVLAISGLLDKSGSRTDSDNFSNACAFIEELRQVGSFAANEFTKHLDALRASMAAFELERASRSQPFSPSAASSVNYDVASNHIDPTMTAGMALTDESLQAILAQPLLDLDRFDTAGFNGTPGFFDSDPWGDVWSA